VKQVQQFLGLVRYLNAFLPRLSEQTSIFSKLTTKTCDKKFPEWNDHYQLAFDKIKQMVVSRECLTVIDHNKLDVNKIFLTTDASDHSSGAVLSFGPNWEAARPVAFDSTTFKEAELNYPVHEKELLAVIQGHHKWRSDLLGAPFFVYTDHKTLLNFDTQKDLS
jgi:RNase H-like domain found in reverse transcriptase